MKSSSLVPRYDSCLDRRLHRIARRTIAPCWIACLPRRGFYNLPWPFVLLAIGSKSGLRSIDRHWFAWHCCCRRLSMRPTQEELEERNILKSKLSIRWIACESLPYAIEKYYELWLLGETNKNVFARVRRAKSRRGEEAKGGEEAIPAAKAQLSTDRRGTQGEKGTPVCSLDDRRTYSGSQKYSYDSVTRESP